MKENNNTLKRDLGLIAAISIVVGNMIGSGIYGLPSALAKVASPSVTLLAWISVSIGAIIIALSYGNLSKYIPKAGGPVVYAEAANKKESYPISVKVRIYTKIYITYDYDGVKWHNKNGDVLDNSTETHGKYTPGTVPYYSFKNAMNGNYITIPFEATDIKEIRFSQSGGFSQLNITTGLDIPNDYSKGVIKIMHTGGVWMQGTVEVTLTAETIDGTIITHKINVEPEM